MPLPTADMAWPPLDHRVITAMADWSTWWAGDPIELAERYGLYGMRHGAMSREEPRARGLLGWAQRWWWGARTAPGEQLTKYHLPVAGDLARVSADLLFSEPPALHIDDSMTTQTAVDNLIDDGLHVAFLEGAELAAAVGGCYLRVVWDDSVRDTPWIDVVGQDTAIPDLVAGVLKGVTFWTEVQRQGQIVWRHLERHEPGRILHGLYQGTPTNLGQAVPLADVEQTAGLADQANAEGAILTGIDTLTAAYVPNMRPARAWRHIPAVNGWGRSDFQSLESTFDAIDEVYSSWMRDIRIGKGRIIVPQGYLDQHGPGRGASWNEDREVYSTVNALPRSGDGGMQLTSTQFAIRYQEHTATLTDLMEHAVRLAGYSGATFGFAQDGSAMTATEIRSRERRSMTTRARKTLYWGPAVRSIVLAWLGIAQAKFGMQVKPCEPSVEFRDSVAPAPQELAQTAQLLRAAEAISTDQVVRLVHPDWDEDQTADEVIRIQGEYGRSLADPTQVGDEQPAGPQPLDPQLYGTYPGEPDGDEGPIVPMGPAAAGGGSK